MTLGLALSYALLCLVQWALVLAPLETGRRRRLPAVGLLVPVAALALGVGSLRAFAASPRALTGLAVVATPLLAGCSGWLCHWRRPSVALVLAGSLYLFAWQLPSLAGQAAAVALIGLACLAVAAAVASVAPPRSIGAGLVLLAAVDVVLVWGVGQVGPATTALRGRACRRRRSRCLPIVRCRRCSRQRSARRLWAGSICSRRRCCARRLRHAVVSAPRSQLR